MKYSQTTAKPKQVTTLYLQFQQLINDEVIQCKGQQSQALNPGKKQRNILHRKYANPVVY